ncbi:DUF721 domain-containing protein [Candidatus Berkelbacteria bacterium]|nr:DUF721 domain-containing protein [Candidatus Berkelbacteria bacterium]
MEPLHQILKRRLRTYGLDQLGTAATICVVADRLGQGRFRAHSWQHNCLTVIVSNGPVAHALRLEEERLKDALRDQLGWPPTYAFRLRIRIG